MTSDRRQAEKAIRELEREIPDAYVESASVGPEIVLSKESAETALAALRSLLSETEACGEVHPVTGRTCSLPAGHEPGHVCGREPQEDEWEYEYADDDDPEGNVYGQCRRKVTPWVRVPAEEDNR